MSFRKEVFINAYQLCCWLKGLRFSWILGGGGDFCKHLSVRKGIIAEEMKNAINVCRYLQKHSCLVIFCCPVVYKDPWDQQASTSVEEPEQRPKLATEGNTIIKALAGSLQQWYVTDGPGVTPPPHPPALFSGGHTPEPLELRGFFLCFVRNPGTRSFQRYYFWNFFWLSNVLTGFFFTAICA